jgi:hypothetical protein
MLGDLTYLVWFRALISDAAGHPYVFCRPSVFVFNNIRTVRTARALGREFGKRVAFKGSVLGLIEKKKRSQGNEDQDEHQSRQRYLGRLIGT